MLSIAEAFSRVDQSITLLESLEVSIVDAVGMRLAGDIVSDVDSPPFDKSMMDGFAMRANDASSVPLKVIGTLYAGSAPTIAVNVGQSIRIMTGAPIPEGADCVLRSEDAEFDESAMELRLKALPSRGDNIITRGTSMRAGDAVLGSGLRLNAASVGVLAELGRPTVNVVRRPEVAILATGDELVPIDAVPTLGQIRNSNEPMLCACVANCGGSARPLGVSRDVATDLDLAIANGLRSDILCLSGGVSAGEKDLVPAALKRAGVREVFHKVNLKPGKPLWFGVHSARIGRTCLVFGLPGNPVSSLVCFELFVRHAMERMQGAPVNWRLPLPVRLAGEVRLQAERPVYHPARMRHDPKKVVIYEGGRPIARELQRVEILNWQGSSDLRGVALAEGVVHVPVGNGIWPAGSIVEFLPFAGAC